MNDKLKAIIRTKKDIEKMGHTIENNIIKRVDVDVIAHFGNAVCFEIECKNVFAMGVHHNTANLGYIIKSFLEMFDLSKEDGVRISNIRDIPCRLVYEGKGGWGSRCIGFGHFMEDRFVLTDDFAKVGLENGKQ